MNGKIPHIVQYQGSKRKLAAQILEYMPRKFNRLLEPFSGMAAISIAAAYEQRAKSYHINDINEPLIKILEAAVNSPASLIHAYRDLWNEQFTFSESHLEHYYEVRNRFNAGDASAVNMLYLLARCVKGSVRYSSEGKFNQSPDKRRHGTNPDNLQKNVLSISHLLKGRTVFTAKDYREILAEAKRGDIVYMDPPYQGVSNVRDNRYLSGLDFNEFAVALDDLNKRGIDFLISYDGLRGTKQYGNDLPKELECKKVLLDAGLSSQATLLGRREVTYEALYISKGLSRRVIDFPEQLVLLEAI